MRVISMVPSWTETLIECGVDVVGRTRFCIHPGERVRGVPVCGGTKNIDLEKARALKPDLLLLDREENPEAMAKDSPCEWLATHVTSVQDVGTELRRIADRLAQQAIAQDKACVEQLRDQALRWERIASAPKREIASMSDLPGVIEWLKRPDESAFKASSPVAYVIWRDPWMAVTRGTFIASVLETLGIPSERLWPKREPGEEGSMYPSFELERIPEKAVLLFSSEPFPFHKKKDELLSLPWASAIVDGESFSWFGVRSLRFLEEALKRSR